MRSSVVLAGARITTWLRGGEGARVGVPGARPQQSLVLYEFEACPFCRRVREAFTRLDLEASIRPCPKGGLRYRAEVEALGGKQQFPFLVDPNSDRRMYESSEIVAYLDHEYGRAGSSVASPEPRAFATLALIASGIGRGNAGSRARASRCPDQPLVLYGYEAQPESRLVREVLCELELPYQSRPAAPGSARRSDDEAQAWRGAQAKLIDPNCQAEVSGWQSIIDHLERTYALAPA